MVNTRTNTLTLPYHSITFHQLYGTRVIYVVHSCILIVLYLYDCVINGVSKDLNLKVYSLLSISARLFPRNYRIFSRGSFQRISCLYQESSDRNRWRSLPSPSFVLHLQSMFDENIDKFPRSLGLFEAEDPRDTYLYDPLSISSFIVSPIIIWYIINKSRWTVAN